MDEADRFITGLLKSGNEDIKRDYDRANTASYGADSGEMRLLRAVLEDAFLSIKGRYTAGVGDRRQADARRDAIAWVERFGDEPFQFKFVCHYLNLDCEAVRKAAREAYGQATISRHGNLNRVK